MSGYELTQFLQSSAKWVWSAPQSQIYPLLRRLEAEGWIAGEVSVRGERLRRTTYSLTDDGLLELRRWIVESVGESEVRDPLLLKALFFDLAEPQDACSVLLDHITELEGRIAQWREHRALLLAGDTPLLRERLRRRAPTDHEHIQKLKAHVFDALIDGAEQRVQWSRRAIQLLGEGPTRNTPLVTE